MSITPGVFGCGNKNCKLCYNQEEKTMGAIVLNEQKKYVKDKVERANKYRVERLGYGAPSFEVAAVTGFLGDSEPYANVYLNDGDNSNDDGNPTTVTVKASLAELEKMEAKIFEARKKLAAAKQPTVTRVSGSWVAAF